MAYDWTARAESAAAMDIKRGILSIWVEFYNYHVPLPQSLLKVNYE